MDAPALPLDQPTDPCGRGRGLLWISLALALVAAVYLAQVPTPLRMNTDAIDYLLMASSHHDGHGFVAPHRANRFPHGYAAVVATLERFGAARSPAFVAFNEAMLAVTFLAGGWLIRRWLGLPRGVVLAVVGMAMLSRATVRYSAIPGTEPVYMAVSTLGLACLTRAVGLPRPQAVRALAWWAAGALGLTAVWFRSIGIVFAPAIAWALVLILWQRRRSPVPLREWAATRRRPLLAAGGAAAVAAGVGAWVVSRTVYFREGLDLFRSRGLATEVTFALRSRMIDAASILTNLWWRNPGPGQRLLAYLGLIALPVILLVVARRARRPSPVDVYLAGYVAVLMVWPYKADNRFWLPIELFVYALVARELLDAARRGAAWARPVAVGWAALFVWTGAAVLVWTTRLTYAGDRFSERYDLDFMRDAYRAASHNGLPADLSKTNPDLVVMIRRYGRPQFGP